MGEVQGGREEAARPTTDQIARAVARECFQEGRQIAQVYVQRITEGLFAVEVHEHGASGPERFLWLAGEDELTPQ